MSPCLKAVRSLPRPRYPTWDLVRTQPCLLAREVPDRWQGRAAVIAALTAATLGASASGKAGPSRRPIAVVFEHGAGRGSYGCEAIAPPTFLSEEEARQVVTEELRRAGLKPVPGARTIPSLVRQRYYVYPDRDAVARDEGAPVAEKGDRTPRNPVPTFITPERQGAHVAEQGDPKPLALDGYDSMRRVGYAFVSQARYKELGGMDRESYGIEGSRGEVVSSSVQSYDFEEAARDLARRINAQAPKDDQEAVAVFYDPSVPLGRDVFKQLKTATRDEPRTLMTEALEAAKDSSRALLRLQVQDFAVWLHEQGILR
jgi:hypothetical protein